MAERLSLHILKKRHGLLRCLDCLACTSSGLEVAVRALGRQDVTGSLQMAMTLGELFLKSLSSGVITQGEVDWLAFHQHAFSRHEEAAAIRLGRLMDEGVVNLGCRLTPQWLHHRDVLEHWIEPLGRRRHAVRH